MSIGAIFKFLGGLVGLAELILAGRRDDKIREAGRKEERLLQHEGSEQARERARRRRDRLERGGRYADELRAFIVGGSGAGGA